MFLVFQPSIWGSMITQPPALLPGAHTAWDLGSVHTCHKKCQAVDMFGTHQSCWVMINSTFIGHPPLSKIRKGEALDTARLTWGSNSCEGPVVTHWGTGAILGLHLGGIAMGDVRWGYQGWPSPAIRKQEELGPLTPIGKLMETVCLNMSLQNRSGYVQTMFASCLRWNVYFPQR